MKGDITEPQPKDSHGLPESCTIHFSLRTHFYFFVLLLTGLLLFRCCCYCCFDVFRQTIHLPCSNTTATTGSKLYVYNVVVAVFYFRFPFHLLFLLLFYAWKYRKRRMRVIYFIEYIFKSQYHIFQSELGKCHLSKFWNTITHTQSLSITFLFKYVFYVKIDWYGKLCQWKILFLFHVSINLTIRLKLVISLD